MATILGNTKGILGFTNTVTGLVLETSDYDFNGEDLEFLNESGDATAFTQTNQKADFTLKGYLIAGTAYSGTINSLITLTIPAYITGNTGGSAIIKTIKLSEGNKQWKGLEIGGTYYPHVVTGS